MSWGDAAKRGREVSGGMFWRLKDGDAAKFVVLGEPGERYQTYNEKTKEYAEVEPGTPNAQVQFGIPCFDLGTGEPRILTLSPGTFVRLAEKIDEFGQQTVYRIKRKGSDKTTKYEIDQLGAADGDTTLAIKRATPPSLFELGFYPLGSGPKQPQEAGTVDEIPFSEGERP